MLFLINLHILATPPALLPTTLPLVSAKNLNESYNDLETLKKIEQNLIKILEYIQKERVELHEKMRTLEEKIAEKDALIISLKNKKRILQKNLEQELQSYRT